VYTHTIIALVVGRCRRASGVTRSRPR